MKKTTIIIVSVVVFIAGILVFYKNRPAGQSAPATNPLRQSDSEASQTGEPANNSRKWETKTDEQANVTVAITPLDLSAQSAEWKFEVVMDTHSVELDQDMTKSAVLIDDQGKEYTPLKWDGPTGGHHREGILIFNPISPRPQSLELKITGIADTVRIFNWQLKK